LWASFAITALVITGFALLRGEPHYGDERDYLEIARNIASGEGYTYFGEHTAIRPPAWPLLLSAALVLGVPPAGLVVLSVASMVGAALLARGIARCIAGDVAGWVAGFGMLLYPLNVYTAATLYPQALATMLFLLPIYLVVRFADRFTWWMAMTVGLSLAVLMLAVPTMVLTAALVFTWAAWRFRAQLLRFLSIATLAALVPMGAWWAHNLAEFDAFIPLSTATGFNLLMGNSENASVTTGAGTDIGRYVAASDAAGLDEVERDKFFTHQAAKWVTEHPGEAAILYGQKVIYYFAPYNATVTVGQASSIEELLSVASYVPLLLAAAGRIALRRRLPFRSPEALLWVLFLGNALFMAITFTRVRFRQPLDAVLVIEASVLVAIVFAMIADRRGGSSRCDVSATPDGRSGPAAGTFASPRRNRKGPTRPTDGPSASA
jgi:4-amino-4-deoxy-L-arabinose transferase-like glycosyltransferase